MKRTIIIAVVLAAELFLMRLAPAQGTLYVSNLGQTPTGSANIGSDSWIAQEFFTVATDPNSYTLNSIQLLMDTASGSPSGFNVSIYSSTGGIPKTDLGNLAGSLNPSAGGLFTYTASGITISPGIPYFVVVTAATPVAQGAYTWSAANSFISSGTWNIDDAYYSSANGLSWTYNFRQDVFQLGIYATPTPEPATYALVGLELAALCFWRRKR